MNFKDFHECVCVYLAALLVDKAMELRYIGGVFGGNVKPTPFLCLILKMLQIQPEKDIVVEFIRNEDFKYVVVVCLFFSFCLEIVIYFLGGRGVF